MLNCAVSTVTKPPRSVHVKHMLADCGFMHGFMCLPLLLASPVFYFQLIKPKLMKTSHQKNLNSIPRVTQLKMVDGDVNNSKVHPSGQSDGPEGQVKSQFFVKELGNESALR